MKTIKIADLFCGAGGTSAGAIEAAEFLGYRPELTAVNHWPVAIETHSQNHPNARHLCTGIDSVNPRELFGPNELGLLWASPECTHHSTARGGKPMNEQSRATAWCVIRWADALLPPVILVENVPEFLTWGPIDSKGKPLQNRKGELFAAWVGNLKALGYKVDWRVLCAADYGDPTTRKRLFVQAVRGRRRIVWPEPSHAPTKTGGDAEQGEMFLSGRKPWRTAREIIDWGIEGQSIYERTRPLSAKTMKRIMAGLKKFGLKPFVVPNFGEHAKQSPRGHSMDEPLPTVTASGAGNLVQPFILPNEGIHGGNRARTIDEPLNTVTAGSGAGALVRPYLVELRGTTDDQVNASGKSVDAPLSAVATSGAHHGLAEPFILAIDHQGGSGDPIRPIGEPLSTISTKARHCLASPYLVQVAHGNGKCGDNGNNRRVKPLDEPLPTVTGQRGDFALCEPSLLPQQSDGVLRPVSEPCPTVATAGAIALVEPFLVSYNSNSNESQSVAEPLDTVTTKDRHALVRPEIVMDGKRYLLDIRFRMLQPHELAAAQGFPKGYKFAGTKTEQVKQIGNAVPRRLARAIVKAVLGQ